MDMGLLGIPSGSWSSLLAECQTRDWKVASSNPGRSSGQIFFSRDTAVAHPKPRSFCQKCRWQVTPEHAYTLDPTKLEWVDYATVQAECGNLSESKLIGNSSWNTRAQLFQLAEPLWTRSWPEEWNNVHEQIPSLKKKRRAHAGNKWSNLLWNPCKRKLEVQRSEGRWRSFNHHKSVNCVDWEYGLNKILTPTATRESGFFQALISSN